MINGPTQRLRRVALGVFLGMASMTSNLAGAAQSAPPYAYGSPVKSFVRDVTMQGSANAVATVDGSSVPVLNSNGSFSVSGSATSTVPYVTNVSDKGLGYNSAYAKAYFYHEFPVAPGLYSVTSTLNFTSASGSNTSTSTTLGTFYPFYPGYTIYSASGYTAKAHLQLRFRPSWGGSPTPAYGPSENIPLGSNTSRTLSSSITAGEAGYIIVEVYIECSAYAQGTAAANAQAAGTVTTTLSP